MRYTFKATSQSSKLLRGLNQELLCDMLLNGDYTGDRLDSDSKLTGYVQFPKEQNALIKSKAASLGLHISEFLCYALQHYAKGSHKSYRLSESWYQHKLHQKLGGVREVPIEGVGRIDLLTSDRIIELKRSLEFKHALGQVIAYGFYYPHHQKTLGLIGMLPNRAQIERICLCNCVDVWWLDCKDGKLIITN